VGPALPALPALVEAFALVPALVLAGRFADAAGQWQPACLADQITQSLVALSKPWGRTGRRPACRWCCPLLAGGASAPGLGQWLAPAQVTAAAAAFRGPADTAFGPAQWHGACSPPDRQRPTCAPISFPVLLPYP